MLWAAQPRNVCGVSHFMDYQAVSHLSDLAHSSGVVAAAQSGRVAKGFFWNVGLRHYLAHGRRLCAGLGNERFQLGKAHRADAGHQIRQNAKTNAFRACGGQLYSGVFCAIDNRTDRFISTRFFSSAPSAREPAPFVRKRAKAQLQQIERAYREDLVCV